MGYVRPLASSAGASFQGAALYERPLPSAAGASWVAGEAGNISTQGFDGSVFGGATAELVTSLLLPGGIAAPDVPGPGVRNAHTPYVRPPQLAADASWVGAPTYARPMQEAADATWHVGFAGTLYPSGFTSQAFGVAEIIKGAEWLTPPGFAALQAGQPTIYNLNRYLSLGGIASKLAFGSTKIENRDRYITPVGKYSTLFGTAFMQGGVVQVLVSGIAPPALTQKPWASFSPRWIEAGDLKAPGVSVPLVGGTRHLEPHGFEATQWGERIVPESQTLYPEGHVLSLWGDAKPWNYTTWVSPLPIKWSSEELRFGTATTWNLRQFVQHRHDVEHTDAFGVWTGIENRNRVITHHSTAPGLLPAPQVENAARPLLPAAIASPAVPGTSMVSHGVREYTLEGIEPPLMSRWLTVQNGARLVQPTGFTATTFGDNRPANNRRYFPYITAGDQQIINAPMVAFAIREVAQDSRYAIAPPLVPLPGVKLHTRYVEAPGFDVARYGGHHLHIHWNIIAPRWIHSELTGEASVRNVTPEVRTHGRDSAEFGDAAIRTQWRRVEASGLSAQVFGLAKIADRRQRVYPPGIQGLTVGDKLKVERTGIYIPEQQYIVQTNPHGYHEITLDPVPAGETHGMGEPVLNVQSAHPAGFDALKFGDVMVAANSIRVEPGYQNYKAFGEHSISLKTRRVEVEEFKNDPLEQVGKPRLSPHTIWACVEAPSQAIWNHPPANRHYVDYSPASGLSLKGPGKPVVTLRHRRITTSGHSFLGMGQPSLHLRRKYVTPEGLRSLRMGWHEVSGSVRYVRPKEVEAELYGIPTLTRYWRGPQTVYPLGISGAVPAPSIDFFHRTLKPSGFSSLSMGNSRGEPPYAWQSLHVGPPMPTIPEGFNAEQFGSTGISLRVRDISVPGFDAFLSEYDFRDFALRMRVRGTPAAGPVTRGVVVQGFNAFSGDCPGNISNWVQYIRPDGNMDNHRKGAPS